MCAGEPGAYQGLDEEQALVGLYMCRNINCLYCI